MNELRCAPATARPRARRPETAIAVPLPVAAAPVRLLCFPNAGAGAGAFRRFAEPLAPYAELRVVRLPGREQRINEPPHERLETLLTELTDTLQPDLRTPPGQRLAFFGHSMGALVAFELTRRLRAAGHRLPDALLVSGGRAPHVPPPADWVTMHTLTDGDFLRRLPSYGGTPAELLRQPELLRLFLPTLRADFAVVETYRYRPGEPLDIPVAAYGGGDDAEAPIEAMAGWREQTTAAFRHRVFPGGHFYLAERVDELARTIVTDLVAFDRAGAPRR